jgi:hypothetical protein
MMPTSPAPGAPALDWDVAVERADAGHCTYWLTVKNLTAAAVNFEGRYARALLRRCADANRDRDC